MNQVLISRTKLTLILPLLFSLMYVQINDSEIIPCISDSLILSVDNSQLKVQRKAVCKLYIVKIQSLA